MFILVTLLIESKNTQQDLEYWKGFVPAILPQQDDPVNVDQITHKQNVHWRFFFFLQQPFLLEILDTDDPISEEDQSKMEDPEAPLHAL